jgi:hypothetical protein
MLSVIQTLRLRNVNVLDYLSAAVQAHRKGLSPPAIPEPANRRPAKIPGVEPSDVSTSLVQDLRKIA